MNSFLPSTIKLWNELPLQIRILPTVSSFKKAIKTYSLESQTNFMTLDTEKANIIHCQIRNNARNLNADLFNHFLCENSICDMCGYVSENAYHYFFVCPHYDVQRQVFIQSITNLNLDIPTSVDLLLYGDCSLPYNKNVAIFKIVHDYIIDTKRFKF